MKTHFAKLQEAKDPGELFKFCEELIEKKGKYDSSYLRRFRSVIDEKESEETEEWQPWKQAAEKYGEPELLEMVEAKSILSRPSTLLPPTTKIPYPRNLEVYVVGSKQAKRRRTQDTNQIVDRNELDTHSRELAVKDFTKAITDRRNVPPRCLFTSHPKHRHNRLLYP